MALHSLTRVPVDTSAFSTTVVQVGPKKEQNAEGEMVQRVDKATGLPIWSVEALMTDTAGEVSIASVSVPAASKPEVAGPARFIGLTAGVWHMERRAGMWLRAEGVEPAAPASDFGAL